MSNEPLIPQEVTSSLSSRRSAEPYGKRDVEGNINNNEEFPAHIRTLVETLDDRLRGLVLVSALTYFTGTSLLVLTMEHPHSFNPFPTGIVFFWGVICSCLFIITQVVPLACRLHKEYEPLKSQMRVFVPRASWLCRDICCDTLNCSWPGMWADLKELSATVFCCENTTSEQEIGEVEAKGCQETTAINQGDSTIASPPGSN